MRNTIRFEFAIAIAITRDLCEHTLKPWALSGRAKVVRFWNQLMFSTLYDNIWTVCFQFLLRWPHCEMITGKSVLILHFVKNILCSYTILELKFIHRSNYGSIFFIKWPGKYISLCFLVLHVPHFVKVLTKTKYCVRYWHVNVSEVDCNNHVLNACVNDIIRAVSDFLKCYLDLTAKSVTNNYSFPEICQVPG